MQTMLNYKGMLHIKSNVSVSFTSDRGSCASSHPVPNREKGTVLHMSLSVRINMVLIFSLTYKLLIGKLNTSKVIIQTVHTARFAPVLLSWLPVFFF